MRFALHDLHPNQLEDLVVEICHELLGAGVQKFANGPDGGRDGKFVGTAQAFPSHASPLVGSMIIQAKHTINAVGKFSDPDFGGPSASSTLSEEIPRLMALRRAGEAEHYLLFANRRLGAIANTTIVGRIQKDTAVQSVHLFGVEQIERYVKRYDYLASTLSSFEYDRPLRASPDDLAEVITNVANRQKEVEWPTSDASSIERVAFKTKNELNGLSDEYARLIARNYLKHFGAVQKFLADPINADVLRSYNNAVDEFAGKLLIHRSDFETYDRLLDYLVSMLIERDADLRAHRRITRIVFYFMYWACDIGEADKNDASPK